MDSVPGGLEVFGLQPGLLLWTKVRIVAVGADNIAVEGIGLLEVTILDSAVTEIAELHSPGRDFDRLPLAGRALVTEDTGALVSLVGRPACQSFAVALTAEILPGRKKVRLL